MKSKIIGKKQLLSFSLVLALGLSVYVNWYYTNNFNDISEPETSQNTNLGEAQLVNSNSTVENDYYTQAKVNRTKAHDEAIKTLEDIISNKDSDKDTIALAQNKLVNISQQIKLESDIENIIKAQVSNDCLVTYSEDSIEVIMPKGTVKDETVVKIKDIVISKTNLQADKIIIIELK